jgi:hypothetical protein
MPTRTTGQGQGRGTKVEPCICRAVAAHIIDALGITSEEARQHVHNARLEMLKAMRAIIDERINHLSQTAAKGTKVAVE